MPSSLFSRRREMSMLRARILRIVAVLLVAGFPAPEMAKAQSGESNSAETPSARQPGLSSAGIQDIERDLQGFTSDCNRNGIADMCDINCGFPDEGCEVERCGRSTDCNANGVPDDCDIADASQLNGVRQRVSRECKPCIAHSDCTDGLFCNGSERCSAINYCLVGTVPCTAVKLCDEDANACMPDCNNNRIIDSCDVACGDECDDATCGSSFDCNENDLPDECEVGLLARLSDPASSYDDKFASSVALDGDVAVVGAPGVRCNPGVGCGAAYVYRFDPGAPSGLRTEAVISVSDLYTVGFGRSVAVSGNTVVVGADGSYCFDKSACHAAYVFRFDGTDWVEEARLTPPDTGEMASFGQTVAISDDTIVVSGTENTCESETACRAFYVFRRDPAVLESWALEAKLTPSDASAGNFFGQSIAISNDAIVVEMRDADCAQSNSCGAAYVFRFAPGSQETWVEAARLMIAGSTPISLPRFVDISGDLVVVGVRGGRCPSSTGRCGRTYFFRLGSGLTPTWVLEAELSASNQPGRVPYFGGRVVASGDLVAFALGRQSCFARTNAAARTGCGEVAVYRRSSDITESWVEVGRLADPESGDNGFASSMAVSENRILVTAPTADCFDGGYGCGAAYAFAVGSFDCNESGVPDDCEDVSGADFNADGSVDLADWRSFTDCMAGPGDHLNPTIFGCAQLCRRAFDFDTSGNVSLEDAAEMLNLLSSP